MLDTTMGFTSLAVIAVSAALWFRGIQRVAIPENRGFFIVAWIVAAVSGVAALLGEPGWLGGISAGIGVFGAVFFLGTVAIGRQKVGDTAIQVGASIPHFTAADEHGQMFDSQSLAGHPVLIKFFRGHW